MSEKQAITVMGIKFTDEGIDRLTRKRLKNLQKEAFKRDEKKLSIPQQLLFGLTKRMFLPTACLSTAAAFIAGHVEIGATWLCIAVVMLFISSQGTKAYKRGGNMAEVAELAKRWHAKQLTSARHHNRLRSSR